MSDRSSNRRGFIRVPFHTEVEITADSRTVRSQKDLDVSMSGLRLTVDSGDDSAIAIGAACNARIILAASENRVAIEAAGTVVRSEPGSVAIEFTELDLDSYNHLRQLILNNTDEPEKAEEEFSSHWGIKPPHS